MNTDLTYLRERNGTIMVFLHGKYVGNIRPVAGGYRYETRCGKHFGQTMRTEQEVKNSLTEESEN